MTKRFKSKKKRNFILLKIIIYLIIVYIIFSIIFKSIYKAYLNNLTEKQIIDNLIRYNQLEESPKKNSFNKYFTPESILKYTLDLSLVKDKPKEKTTFIEKSNPKQVYIYHTHNTENYSNKYLEPYNIIPDVITVSYILEDYLSDFGVETEIEKQKTSDILKQNSWSYNKSYDASRQIIYDKIKKNNYKLIIDLHRDSTNLDKTTINYETKKYARTLFVIGEENPNYEENYQIASYINNELNKIIPSISRGIIKKSGIGVNGVYNQDINNKMILIEIGGQYNEIEELNNTSKILATAILHYIENNNEE